MKVKVGIVAILTLFNVVAAQECAPLSLPLPSHCDGRFVYTEIGASFITPGYDTSYGIGLGLGMRGIEGRHMTDFSMLFLAGRGPDRGAALFIPFSVRYLYSWTPDARRGLYWGGGLGIGGIGSAKQGFGGILADITLGFELFRGYATRHFVEARLLQPTPIGWAGGRGAFTPSLAVMFGMGF